MGATQPANERNAAFNEERRQDLTAEDIRFTRKGNTLYAFIMGWPEHNPLIRALATGTPLAVGNIQHVEMLGCGGKIQWSQGGSGLRVQMPPNRPCDHAVTLKIAGAIAG